MVEVDVPEVSTNLESTQLAAAWVTEGLGAHAFQTSTRSRATVDSKLRSAGGRTMRRS